MKFLIIAFLLFANIASAEEDMSALLLGEEVVGKKEEKAPEAPQAQTPSKPSAEAVKADNILKNMANLMREEKLQAKMTELSDTAPLGLKWGTSKKEVEDQKVILTAYNDNKYPETYTGSNFPKELPSAENVVLSFGEDNRLWRIVIISKIQTDDKDGIEIMKTYDDLKRLLTKKYGEGIETKKGFDAPPAPAPETRRRNEPAPMPLSFTESMMKRQKMVYNQFKKDGVEIMLTLGAKSASETYYTLSYKFLPIIEDREKKQLDAL